MLSPELLGFLEPLYVFIPFYIGLGFLMIVPFVIWLSKYLNKNKKRHPLTENLLRMPGQTLLIELDKNSEKLDEHLMGLFMFALIASPTIFYNYSSEKRGLFLMSLALVVIFIVYLVYGTVKIMRLRKRFNELKLGFECEVAVGQELNQLMLDGYRVFHDFQADNKFNIDHIVIGKGGVFAVETKGRAKPINKKSNWENARVKFDGEKLIFPTWIEKKPIEQANNNAKWLENWIKKNTGEEIKVMPVLALPGWFVEENKDKSLRPRVVNPTQIVAKLKEYQSVKISSNEIIEKIAHKIEEKCRDIEPKAYKNT